jgi:hypothetical protein
MSADSDQETAPLLAELQAARLREASFRVQTVREFLEHGERNTYAKSLRDERTALVERAEEASRDVEGLTRKLEAAGIRSAALEAELAEIRSSLAWRVARLFGPAPKPGPKPGPAGVPAAKGGVFTYYLHTSPFRIYRGPAFTLRGWALPDGGEAVTAIRANVDGRLFAGRLGFEEPEVIARYGPQAANPKPGFEVTFDTPAGRHQLAIEAEVGGADWRTIVATAIWCEASGG